MKATILLAEDERDMREVLCDYFAAKSGGEIAMVPAPDGDTALHLIETQPFDLLLLDIMLPGTDGFALCRAAREQSDAPILFVTAREDEQDKLHGYGLGRMITLSNRFRSPCCMPRHRRSCAVRAA